MVTASTYQKQLLFNTNERLIFLQDSLLQLSDNYKWSLQAWAIFPNRYHFIAHSKNPLTLSTFISNMHVITAKEINRQDNTIGRQVWFQFWDSLITYNRSYFARLNYVNQNAVKHGIAETATAYPWCSAAWFERSVPISLWKTVQSFKIDNLNLYDDF